MRLVGGPFRRRGKVEPEARRFVIHEGWFRAPNPALRGAIVSLASGRPCPHMARGSRRTALSPTWSDPEGSSHNDFVPGRRLPPFSGTSAQPFITRSRGETEVAPYALPRPDSPHPGSGRHSRRSADRRQ